MSTKRGLGKGLVSLTQLSPTDKGFDSHKSLAQKVSKLFAIEDGFLGFIAGSTLVSFERFSARIGSCGFRLKFVRTPEGKLKLVEAKFCKVPMCPSCQWRRSLKWRARFLTLLPSLQEKYSGHRWIFLTLTVRNCELADLRLNLQALNQAFNRLSQLKRFPMDGLVKSVEVTRAWDCYDRGEYLGRHGTKWIMKWEYDNKRFLLLEPTMEVHPHLHILGLVPSGYFGKNYINHEDWTQMWQQSLRVDYKPIVNIKAVKPRRAAKLIPDPESFTNDTSSDETGMIKAVCETLKYTVKEKDLVGEYCKDDNFNSTWLKLLTQQLYKTRKVEYRGILKEIEKELEEARNSDDLINISGEKESSEDSNLEELEFYWMKVIQQYVLSESNKSETEEVV